MCVYTRADENRLLHVARERERERERKRERELSLLLLFLRGEEEGRSEQFVLRDRAERRFIFRRM